MEHCHESLVGYLPYSATAGPAVSIKTSQHLRFWGWNAFTDQSMMRAFILPDRPHGIRTTRSTVTEWLRTPPSIHNREWLEGSLFSASERLRAAIPSIWFRSKHVKNLMVRHPENLLYPFVLQVLQCFWNLLVSVYISDRNPGATSFARKIGTLHGPRLLSPFIRQYYNVLAMLSAAW